MKLELRLPITAKILLVVALAILPCLGVILWSGSRLEAKARGDAEGQCSFIADSVASLQRLILVSVRQGMEGTAMAPPIRDGNPAEAAFILGPLARTNPYFSAMSLVDLEGRAIASSSGARSPGLPLDARILALAAGRGRFAVGGYLRSGAADSLAAGVLVLGWEGRPTGILVAQLRLDAYPSLLALARLPASAIVEIGDREGRRLLRYPADPAAAVGASLDAALLAASAGARDGRVASFSEASGRGYVAAFGSVDGDGDGLADLLVAAKMPRSLAFAELDSILRLTLLLVALSAALSLALALVAARLSIVARIGRLVSVARAYERGELGLRSGLRGFRDELDGLAAALDSMAEALVSREEARRLAKVQLRGALREKDILLKEVYHRVNNNLQLILSLMRLQANSVDDPPTRELLRENEHRVLSMALIHEKLYQYELFASIDFGEYVESMLLHIRQERGALAERIDFQVVAEGAAVDLVRAIPLGLILNELLDNCLKHAFPDGSRGRVRIGLADDGGRMTLTVDDDGVGLPAAGRPGCEAALGLHLARSLAAQLGGELSLGGASPGTRAVLAFPS